MHIILLFFFFLCACDRKQEESICNTRFGNNKIQNKMKTIKKKDHDVRHGEQFMKDIYEALRASPIWNQTLLMIFYDEHVCFFHFFFAKLFFLCLFV